MNQTVKFPASLPLLALIACMMLAVFIFDIFMPLGVAGGVPYVAVVMMGVWVRSPKWIWGVAVVCLLLIVAGYMLSPPPHTELWIVHTNRALAVIAVIAAAVIVDRQARASGKLVQAMAGMELDYDLTKRELADTHLIMADQNARMTGVLDALSDAIITIDEKGRIESFSKSAERMFGYNIGHVYGEDVSILMPEPYHSEHGHYLKRYHETGEARIIGKQAREVEALTRDGRIIPVELTVTELKLYSRKLYCGVLRDITRRKESEHRLQQAQKMETIGHLTGGMAHDFNNLLTAVIGNLELVRDFYEHDEQENKLIDLSLRAANRGADLTQRLLAFSRRQPLQPQVVDVNKAVRNATELLHRILGEHISLESVCGAGLWRARIDPVQLESTLLNLAVNARDAMPEGGKLTIETTNVRLDDEYVARHEELSAGQYVLVAVTDTGTGMTDETLSRVFEPFFTTKEVGKGTGLGLSMVFGFMKQSKGHINVYSEPEHGTTVKLYLPRALGKEEGDAPDDEDLQEAARGGDETILVVEDDPDVMAFVKAALETIGYTVLAACTGAEAIDLVKAEDTPHIDLLLTDVVLPNGMDGRRVAENICAVRPDIRVVYTSGYTQNAIVHHGQVDEGVSFIAKPYTRLALAAIIRRELDRPDEAEEE